MHRRQHEHGTARRTLLAESVDAGKAVDFYIRICPLLQQAYEELGYPKARHTAIRQHQTRDAPLASVMLPAAFVIWRKGFSLKSGPPQGPPAHRCLLCHSAPHPH